MQEARTGAALTAAGKTRVTAGTRAGCSFGCGKGKAQSGEQDAGVPSGSWTLASHCPLHYLNITLHLDFLCSPTSPALRSSCPSRSPTVASVGVLAGPYLAQDVDEVTTVEGELVGVLAAAVPHALVVIGVISLGASWEAKRKGEGDYMGKYWGHGVRCPEKGAAAGRYLGEDKKTLVLFCISAEK